MPCYSLNDKKGKRIGFICGKLGKHCAGCGAIADNLCDYPVGKRKTCDRHICDDCSKRVGVDIHYCPTHAKHWDKFKRNGGVSLTLQNVLAFDEK